ncbi:MAG: glycosyltransferase family 39 protein [Saprospiraceae bacterium]|nr:glycosyltransferase family 39 protein [Saprospiraceae bacterium]
MAKPSRTPAAAAKSTAAPRQQPALPVPAFFSNTLLQSMLLFAFSFLLYANTLMHGFVQDDAIVITDNMFTSKGVEGIPGILSKDTFFGFFKVEGKENLVSGGRYRPLTLVLFALLYQVVGGNPFLFHLVTVLLFSVTCVVLYRTLLLLLRGWTAGQAQAPMVAWIAALLFAAHPIHTEVVANIKGCDEIVTLLGSLGALWFILRAFDTEKPHYSLLAALVFFLACLSKENAATFVVVIPLALWFFRSPSAQLPAILRHSVPVWAAFVVFFAIRGSILHWKFGAEPMELMNNPFLKIEGDHWVKFAPAERLATIFYTLGKYIQLLFVPYPLTHDYYPRYIATKTFADPLTLLILVGYGWLVWFALSGIQRRDPVRFGILFFLLTISIVSNLVFPVGTNMGERFAFMPSVGFCLVVATLLLRLTQWRTAVGIAGVAALLFSASTVLRNRVWVSNEKLFFTDVNTSVNSAKINNACGGVTFEKAQKETDPVKKETMFRQAFDFANQALKIYPNYKDAVLTRAGCQFYLNNFDGAVADYRLAVQLASGDPKPQTYLALALREGGKYFGEKQGNLAKAMTFLTEAWQLNNRDAETARLLGVANGVQRKNEEALQWFAKAVELEPQNASYLFDLGTAYYIAGDAVKGEAYRRQAVDINPDVLKEKNK